jgi:hypothetical protein
MTLELGVYTFGNTPRTGDGYGATAQAIRDALEAVKLAEEVRLDLFGFGEHHTPSMPLSSPTAMVRSREHPAHRPRDDRLGAVDRRAHPRVRAAAACPRHLL